MQIKFEKTKIDVDIYGTQMQVTRPSAAEHEDFLSGLIDADPKDARKLCADWMAGYGFDRAALEKMEGDHFKDLFDQFVSVGKKSPKGS